MNITRRVITGNLNDIIIWHRADVLPEVITSSQFAAEVNRVLKHFMALRSMETVELFSEEDDGVYYYECRLTAFTAIPGTENLKVRVMPFREGRSRVEFCMAPTGWYDHVSLTTDSAYGGQMIRSELSFASMNLSGTDREVFAAAVRALSELGDLMDRRFEGVRVKG